ncbi:hypothetical protein DMENIID0001_125440 [Sergentomyia squamirostris]
MNSEVEDIREDVRQIKKGVATMQTSLDNIASSLLEPPLDLPIQTEDYLEEVEKMLESQSQRRSIILHLRQVMPNNGDRWLEKLMDTSLLMEYTVTRKTACNVRDTVSAVPVASSSESGNVARSSASQQPQPHVDEHDYIPNVQSPLSNPNYDGASGCVFTHEWGRPK